MNNDVTLKRKHYFGLQQLGFSTSMREGHSVLVVDISTDIRQWRSLPKKGFMSKTIIVATSILPEKPSELIARTAV